jgi:F-type H+-transporting ATPase subunit a
MSADDPFHHVRDANVWELPVFVLRLFGLDSYPKLPVFTILGHEFIVTKYMVLQVVALVLSVLVFYGLAWRVRGGKPVSGVWWNFWETLALFIRDQVVRPSIGIPHHNDDHGNGDPHAVDGHHGHGAQLAAGGHVAVEVGHPADKYLPYVWSVFFYVLFCNLLGAIPFLGSPTANINVTGVLAVVTFAQVVFFGTQQSGVAGFWKSLVPHMDLPGPIAIVLLPGIWAIEAGGLLIKHGVLAIRLFANIMAGHTVLGVFLGFIALADGALWGIVMPASILGQVGIGMLELFVAFLQAYVFALLTSLFISAAVNPH